MFYILCFIFYVLYFMFYILCFMFYILYFIFYILYFIIFYILYIYLDNFLEQIDHEIHHFICRVLLAKQGDISVGVNVKKKQ